MGKGEKNCCINIKPESFGSFLLPRMCCGCAIIGCLTITILFFAGIIFVFKSAGPAFHEITNWFSPHSDTRLTTEFQTYVEKTSQVGKLILLERRSQEKITRRIKQTYSLPGFTGDHSITDQASVSIRCPVTFSYYVDMQDKWQLQLRNGRLKVDAPPLRIAPPVIDPGRIEREINGGWLIFGEAVMLTELEKELQVELRNVAMQPQNLERYREDCRKSLEQFVRIWLLNSQLPATAVDITFAREPGKSTTSR